MFLLIAVQAGGGLAYAQTAPAPAAPPPQVQELLKLLEDPATRTWIAQQKQATAPGEAPPQQTPQQPRDTNSEMLASRGEALRTHLASLVAAVPRLPHEVTRAANLLAQELQSRSGFDVLLLVLGFLGLG